VSFLQSSLFCLKFLDLFIEFGNPPVLFSQFLLCSGKISLAEPCKDGIPILLRFLYIGLQFGNIRPVADYLLLVIFRVSLVFGGGTDNATLQPERFYGRSVAVLEDSLSTVFRIIKCFLPISLEVIQKTFIFANGSVPHFRENHGGSACHACVRDGTLVRISNSLLGFLALW